MTNSRKLSRSIHRIDLETPSDKFDGHYQCSLSSDLGHLYQAILWQALTGSFGKRLRREHTGRPGILDLRGKLALMSLKAYTGHPDRKLMERPNTDHQFQFLCGSCPRPDQHLRDHRIVGHIRCEPGRSLDIGDLQGHLTVHWRPYTGPLDISLADATCYGTAMRHPTNVKLPYIIWERKATIGKVWEQQQQWHTTKERPKKRGYEQILDYYHKVKF